MAVKPIAISFKNNQEDWELYKWIVEHSNYSGFIKDILRAAREQDKKENKSSDEKKETQLSDNGTGLIDMNF